MPLYEYKCKKCGHQFERIQKFSDRLVKKCPDCGGAVEQMISAPAVQFKGSGWYVNDYPKSGAKASSAGSDSGGQDSGKDTGKKDDKTTEKKESKSKSESKSEASKKA